MTSIIGLFFLSFLLSLLFTPLISRMAKKYGFVDLPSDRKIHTEPVPRVGGVAICLAFFLTFISVLIYPTLIFELLFIDSKIMIFTLGALMAFFLGLWDDIRPLGAKRKLVVQCLIAFIAYKGGINIKLLSISSETILDLGRLALPFTIFWFLIIMNAINLIDGLDGLAAGVSLFVALTLLVISVSTGRLLTAMGFAVLAGSVLGFLRYNFNPASIFMGDSGSYFLGYMLAGLSIMGSMKGPASVAILIPIIAMGIPLMDVIFAPIRRFVLGQQLFTPDKNHIHHRLLLMGFTHKNAVLLLYAISIVMGILAFALVHARNEGIALILFIFGTTVFLIIRHIGNIRHIGTHEIHDWFMDITDEIGFSRERRRFFNLQLNIYQSGDMKMLWENICKALDKLGFDMAEMCLEKKVLELNIIKNFEKLGYETDSEILDNVLATSCINGQKMIWRRNEKTIDENLIQDYLLKMELPLINKNGQKFGFIRLMKDLRREAITHNTFRRVEHLRRTVLGSLQVLMQNN